VKQDAKFDNALSAKKGYAHENGTENAREKMTTRQSGTEDVKMLA
jgi:hypothetical protein